MSFLDLGLLQEDVFDGTAVGVSLKIVGPCRSFHSPVVMFRLAHVFFDSSGGWNDDGIYIGMLTLPASEPSSDMTMSL